jgi:hypothetical protein
MRSGSSIWSRFAWKIARLLSESPRNRLAMLERVSPGSTVYCAKPLYGSMRAGPKTTGTTILFGSRPLPSWASSKTSSVPRAVGGAAGKVDLYLEVPPDAGAPGPYGDFPQFPVVVGPHARGDDALETGADAADPDGIVDDVVRARLAHGDGWKNDHVTTSSGGLRGATASASKADGDEFRVNRCRVSTGLDRAVEDRARIHPRFIGAGYLRSLGTDMNLVYPAAF